LPYSVIKILDKFGCTSTNLKQVWFVLGLLKFCAKLIKKNDISTLTHLKLGVFLVNHIKTALATDDFAVGGALLD